MHNTNVTNQNKLMINNLPYFIGDSPVISYSSFSLGLSDLTANAGTIKNTSKAIIK